MNCPVCNVELRMMERQGVEIDYCPSCRGVWLDRGELDKILERSASVETLTPEREHERPRYRQYDDDREHEHGSRYKKKKSLLGDLFDF